MVRHFQAATASCHDGLEILVLFCSCYYLCRPNLRQEIITVSEQSELIEKCIKQPQQSRRYERSQTEIHVHHGTTPWDSPTVSLHCQGQHIELGAFLNKREKIQLINSLKRMVRHFQAATAHPVHRN